MKQKAHQNGTEQNKNIQKIKKPEIEKKSILNNKLTLSLVFDTVR